jgi:hypothetical protein
VKFFAASALLLVACASGRAHEITFDGEFRIPELRVVWHALNQPAAEQLKLDWRDLDPKKDAKLPADFWRYWPAPFSPFYAGVKFPAEAFTLEQLYPGGKLVYPQAAYDPNVDYQTFFDLHESLAWLYAFDSAANPFFKDSALRLRAQQLALVHLVGMTQDVPAGNIIGGWAVQYGNCLAWNAHVLYLLDHTQPVDPELKRAWIACLHHIAKTLDAGGPTLLQTGMGHWNLWPVCGAYRLWQASGREEHKALFEKWAKTQLEPDQFTQNGDRSGMSPVGYIRYSGIDLSYNGQAKNWLAPLFRDLGPDSVVGDFARRQYRFASFVTLQEPDGSLTSPAHMNSHAWQSVPYEQWSAHQHLAYAAYIPDAVPFATKRAKGDSIKSSFLAAQSDFKNHAIKMLPPMPFGVRSYPSNYLHLPEALAAFPDREPPDPNVRTRPHEHQAYAQVFRSSRVRDEWFMRRMPAYHATVFAGPCRDEISNYGGRLNGIGSGGLSHVWADGAGTVLLGYSDLTKMPTPDGDYDAVWSQLPVNMAIAEQASGTVLCSGWTGALMTAGLDGRLLRISAGVSPEVRESFRTPMTQRFWWNRQIRFDESSVDVTISIHSPEPMKRSEELLPVAFFADTKVTATLANGGTVPAPWGEPKDVKAVEIHRGGASLWVELPQAASATWAASATPANGSAGAPATVRPLRLAILAGDQLRHASLRYTLRFARDARTPYATVVGLQDGAALPAAAKGTPYEICLESPDAKARYWKLASGKLPAGLSVDRRGLLSGTTNESGTFEFDLLAETPYKQSPFNDSDKTVKGVKLVVK